MSIAFLNYLNYFKNLVITTWNNTNTRYNELISKWVESYLQCFNYLILKMFNNTKLIIENNKAVYSNYKWIKLYLYL
jgi:hypothetical protein